MTEIRITEGAETVVARPMAAGARLPSDFVEAGNFEAAAAAYRKLFLENPGDAGIAEGRLNRMGYRLAEKGEFPTAVAVLKVNIELHPTSSNAYDSLAEIYWEGRPSPRARRVRQAP